MRSSLTDPAAGLNLCLDEVPPPDLRADLASRINDFHSRTVPHDMRRFSVRVTGQADVLQAGVIGVVMWEWLFIEALWVSDTLRGQGVGRRLMSEAEAYARANGCHSCWLDTFQARGFYEQLGYEEFGRLEDFPAGQTRYFLRRRLD